MENATKALTMAANMLLAIMILAIIVYMYNLIRSIPLEQDSAKLIEQAQEFNKQYEVYDKRIMYGVDVLSAVNKAISNNEKYITGSWLSGALSGTEFAIEIEVVLAEPLKETVEVFYHNDLVSPFRPDEPYLGASKTFDSRSVNFSKTSFADIADRSDVTWPTFKLPDSDYFDLYSSVNNWNEVMVKPQEIAINTDLGSYESEKNGHYHFTLLNDTFTKNSIAEENVFLKKLIKTISVLTTSDNQTVNHRQTDDTTLIGLFGGTNASQVASGDTDFAWSAITWTPAVSDFKNRKFKCVGVDDTGAIDGSPGIEYHPNTGAICKLTFVEYEID